MRQAAYVVCRHPSSPPEDTAVCINRRTSRDTLQQVKTFWAVHYYPADLAHSDCIKRKRHARVRSFTDPFRAAAFTSSIWHSKQWRVLVGILVRRTGSGFETSRPF
jgi:hypothetical protein